MDPDRLRSPHMHTSASTLRVLWLNAATATIH